MLKKLHFSFLTWKKLLLNISMFENIYDFFFLVKKSIKMTNIFIFISFIKFYGNFETDWFFLSTKKNILYSLSIVSTFSRFAECKFARSLLCFLCNPIKHLRCHKTFEKVGDSGESLFIHFSRCCLWFGVEHLELIDDVLE